MKLFLLPLLLMLAAFGAKANSLTVRNNTPCDYYLVLYTDAGGQCRQMREALVFIAANSISTFANTGVFSWNSSTPNCTVPGPNFDGVAVYEGPTTGTGNLANLGPHYGWPTFMPFVTTNPCSSGSAQWTFVAGNVQVDIN